MSINIQVCIVTYIINYSIQLMIYVMYSSVQSILTAHKMQVKRQNSNALTNLKHVSHLQVLQIALTTQ